MTVDVREKAEIMRKNKPFIIEQIGGIEDITLDATIDKEIELKVIRCNGENNKKEVDKTLKDSW